jgi:hypothetical protein
MGLACSNFDSLSTHKPNKSDLSDEVIIGKISHVSHLAFNFSPREKQIDVIRKLDLLLNHVSKCRDLTKFAREKKS